MKVFKGIRQFSSNSRKEKTFMIPFYDDKIAVIQEILAVKHTEGGEGFLCASSVMH